MGPEACEVGRCGANRCSVGPNTNDVISGPQIGVQRFEGDAPQLVRMPVATIVASWLVGSADWSWDEERDDLANDPVTEAVRRRVLNEGIGFADAYAPVLLGNDGRVWDGHHRIVIALEQGIPDLMVEMAASEPDEASA